MINIGIVEDDKEIRTTVAGFLTREPDFNVQFAVPSAEAMMEEMKEKAPHVVIMDIGLPGLSGLDAIRWVKDRSPNTDIIMFTVHEDAGKIFDALCHGASGYLLKNTSFDDLKESIVELHAGGAPMSPPIARKVIQFFTKPRNSPLSEKEKQVVQGLVDGLSYKMIAGRLEVTIETIRFHIKNIYSKLHVHSKAEVIAKSLRGEI